MDIQAELKSEIKTRYQRKLAKISIEEKYLPQLLFTEQGGSWLAGPELISFLNIKSLGSEIILVDSCDNLVKVDRLKLLATTIETYKQTMNSWYEELELSRQQTKKIT